MIILPTLPRGYTIFCDDVRHEIGEKTSFIGIYNDSLYVSEMPASIIKINVCVFLQHEIFTSDTFRLCVFLEDFNNEKSIIVAEDLIDFVPPEENEYFDTGRVGQFQEARRYFEIAPLVISGTSLLKVRAFKGDDEYRLGALLIQGQDFSD